MSRQAKTRGVIGGSSPHHSSRGCTVMLLLVACNTSVEPPPGPLTATLALELRDSADVVIDVAPGSSDATVHLTLSQGYGFVDSEITLSAAGRIEAFPEANGTQYSAKFSAPANPSGPCGDSPTSLAFSLYREGNNAAVLGGVAVYCAEQTWHGTPKRVLRLAGTMPLPAN